MSSWQGETLSGGQKQRLALARAVYSDCSIYLLDDPLSALDPNVASRVFQQVVGKHGLLKNKTRILVANQEIFLQQTDQLLMLYGNRVVTYRGLLELSKDNRAPDTLRQSTLHTAWRPSSGQSDDALMLDKDESAGKVTTTEENLSSKGSVKSLLVALKMAGICTPIAVLFFAASGVSVAWQQVWIKQWVDYKPEMQLADTERHCWVRGLMALCLCDGENSHVPY